MEYNFLITFLISTVAGSVVCVCTKFLSRTQYYRVSPNRAIQGLMYIIYYIVLVQHLKQEPRLLKFQLNFKVKKNVLIETDFMCFSYRLNVK